MHMATLQRVNSSLGSEMYNMARLQQRAEELSAKDQEWQAVMRNALHRSTPIAPTLTIPEKQEPVELSVATLTLPSDESVPAGSPVSPGSPMEATSTPAPRRARRAKDGRVGKIRRKRLTKEEEARFAEADIRDLSGTTAAQSRKMTASERDIMLHKRRLRNRQSAARSRDKQRKTVAELSKELEDLTVHANDISMKASRIQNVCETLLRDCNALRQQNDMLLRENAALSAARQPPANQSTICAPQGLGRSSSGLHVSISTDAFDIMNNQGESTGLTPNTSLLRMPGLGILPGSSGQLSDMAKAPGPLRKTNSYLDKMLDFGNVRGDGLGENPDPNSILTRGVTQ